MDNIKNNIGRITSLLNNGERIQKSILGTYQQLSNNGSESQKGVLYATNEKIYFLPLDLASNFSTMDYYKIEAIDFVQPPNDTEMSIQYNGNRHTMSFIEEGDAIDFNHFVLDRMEIKS